MAPIHCGILMIPYQIIDVSGPLDLLSCCSKTIIGPAEAAGFAGLAGLTDRAIDVVFHHINETLSPVTLTAGFQSLPTVTCDECPPLDHLLIGGPDPVNYKLPARFESFVRQHVEAGKGLFTTCTGGLAISSTGVLDGKKATTNWGALELAKMRRPGVQWKRERWVVDGKIWTAGGACAGMDMMAHWIVQNYGVDVAKAGFEMLDFEARNLEGKMISVEQMTT